MQECDDQCTCLNISEKKNVSKQEIKKKKRKLFKSCTRKSLMKMDIDLSEYLNKRWNKGIGENVQIPVQIQ